jgi:hypothetical protein
MYFFSNSPVRWRFTKVVLPVPPSPTRMSFQVGIWVVVAMWETERSDNFPRKKRDYIISNMGV